MNKIELKLPAFSLAEALITLLIVCLITLASIPILTKKKRSLTDIKHGAFACYWDGDKVVGKYYIDGKISDATVQYDSEENKDGCVFNPPSNAKNLIATIIGGGGGGASGYYELKKFIVIDENTGTFIIPADGYYQILLISGGGAGGHTSGGADSQIEHSAFNDEPPASSGTPAGLIYTREYLELKKGYALSYSLGDNATARENNDAVGRCGGDSYVEYYKDYNNKQANDYFRLDSQGGGGGSSADYNSKDECYFYYCKKRAQDEDDCRPADVATAQVKKGFYIREAAHTGDCSASNVKRNRLRSGHSGGTNIEVAGNISRGSFLELHDNTVTSLKGHFYRGVAGAGEFERFGAFKYIQNESNGQWEKSEEADGRRASQGRPFRHWMLTMDVLQRFNIWELEDQDHPFGSGGYGSGGKKRNHENPKGHGGRAVLSIYWPQVYTGNSGNAGNVIQIPFAQLPQKTLVFPGQGGQGAGSGLPGSAGSPGGPSYIKNYSHALGGSGAPAINSIIHYKASAGKLIMGQNGQLANIQPTSKPMGGAGGLSPKSDNGYIDNNSPDGLTREIFKNGAPISFFNNLLGAGAGGGGGSVDVAHDNKIGAGGNGSSGIIFIQW